MGQGINCYAVTIRAFLICADLDGNELPPNEWPIDTLLADLSNEAISVRADLLHAIPYESPEGKIE